MKSSLLLFCVFLLTLGIDGNNDPNIDPASNQLPEFRKHHEKNIGILTNSNGAPVDVKDTIVINSDLLSSEFFLDTLAHDVSSNIPDRVVAPKGTGAFGYFVVTNDISEYTRAKVFHDEGRKTPVVARLATLTQDKGGNDLERENRGLSVKFYTEEGNLDLLCVHVPVFPFNDPAVFTPFRKAFRRSPVTNLYDQNARYDLLTLHPETMHTYMWLLSDYGIPKGYTVMDGFPIQVFELYNDKGHRYFAKFHFDNKKHFKNFTSEEAAIMKGIDLDYFTRDLYNAIAKKDYPTWHLQMDVMSEENLKHVDYDPFDLTRLWKKGTYKKVSIGYLILDKNPINQFAEVEQAIYSPSNLVPGILPGPDNLYKSRLLAYRDTQRNRLGVNFQKIDVNLPKYAKNYNRNGRPPVRFNGKDSPSYYPNSFHGPLAYADDAKPKHILYYLASKAVDLEPAAHFYNHILKDDGQRQRLINNFAATLQTVDKHLLERTIHLLTLIDKDLGTRVEAGVKLMKTQATTQMLAAKKPKTPTPKVSTPTVIVPTIAAIIPGRSSVIAETKNTGNKKEVKEIEIIVEPKKEMKDDMKQQMKEEKKENKDENKNKKEIKEEKKETNEENKELKTENKEIKEEKKESKEENKEIKEENKGIKEEKKEQ